MATNLTDLPSTLWNHPVTKGFRHLFYIVTPAESSFEHKEDVPDYVNSAIPFFAVCILLEQTVLSLKDKPNLRLNDAFSSISAGIFSLLPLVLTRSTELSAYIYVHENYCILELPWGSPWTWLFSFLALDLGYYWAHRMSHEVNFVWAAHQAHHSSEDYNLSTALRQSVLLRYHTWLFYLPMALFAPVTAFMVHSQFNLLYQFWIHTEAIQSLGPLEHILNTPSHHRVHHGRNRYCIDKNYAGTLIVWDRVFGTFAWEEDDIAYGLVHPLASWDVIYTQFCHWKYMFTVANQREGFFNKSMTFLNGPGWEPGKPRLGYEEDIPIIDPVLEREKKYNKTVNIWCHFYLFLHFALSLVAYLVVLQSKNAMAAIEVISAILFILWTLTNIGYIFEHRWYAAPLELLRCAVYLLADTYVCGSGTCSQMFYVTRVIYLISATIWAVQCARSLPAKSTKME